MENNWWWRSVGFWIALQLGWFSCFFCFSSKMQLFSFSFYGLQDFLVCYLCSCCEIQIVLTNKLWVKSHYGGGPKCCHIVLFSRGVHVWTSTMVILEHIFPKFLHNMVDYNTKNSITKKIIFPTYNVQFQSIFVTKTCTSICTKKCKYTQKMIEMIFSLYEICNIYWKLWFHMIGISLWTMWKIW